MRAVFLSIISLLIISAITACGGGGEDATDPQKTTSDATFYLLDTNANFIPWGFDGPVTPSSAALQYVVQSTSSLTLTSADKSKTFTAISSTGLSIKDNNSGTSQTFSLPSNYPDFSWIMDIAYDSKRNLISIVSLSGTGYFYRFDVSNKKWLDYQSVNNKDYKALAYDASNDRYLAITTNTTGSSTIDLLNNDGSFNQSISTTSMLNFDSSYTSQTITGNLKLFPLENDLALVGFSGGKVKAIWKFNIPAKSGSKTYTAP